MIYTVYGNPGTDSETVLYDTDSFAVALDWAVGYTRDGTGGYDLIEVASPDLDGSMIRHWSLYADEAELDEVLYDAES
jgi:hypothetical protein